LLADFISTAHDATTIAKYLLVLRNSLRKTFKNKTMIAYFLFDFSWALINPAMEIFNGYSIVEYLNCAYNELVIMRDKNMFLQHSKTKTKLYLCSTHFLKNLIIHAKKASWSDKVRRAFIFSFSLLQNASSMNEFETYLINTLNFKKEKTNLFCFLLHIFESKFWIGT